MSARWSTVLRLFHLLRRHVMRRAHGMPVACRSAGDPSGVASPMILAMPKSAIFTRPFLSSRMFSGLMSRWTMPSSCANCSASQICGTICSASRGESLPACSSWRRFSPSTNSMMKKGRPSDLAEFVDGDDVRMVQPGQRAGLAVEPLGETRVAPRPAAEEFSARRGGRAPAGGPCRPRPCRPCR